MNYNDYQLPNDKEYGIMKQNYTTNLSRDAQELQQILDKMKDVRASLAHENSDGRYNSILYKYDSNIDELERLIHGLDLSPTRHVNTYSIPNIPSEFRSVRKLQNNEAAISPIRSDDEISRHRNMSTSPNQPSMDRPTTPNTPITEDSPIAPNIPDTSNRNTRANTNKRNRPMQGSILSTLFKKFAINHSQAYSDDGYRNKYHVQVANECISIQKIRTNQIDIVRLLLLYLALNPNCRYCSRIASLASDQFMILNEMSN